jgi:hypothetical protein
MEYHAGWIPSRLKGRRERKLRGWKLKVRNARGPAPASPVGEAIIIDNENDVELPLYIETAVAEEVEMLSPPGSPSAHWNAGKYVYNRLNFETHEIRLLIFEADPMRYTMQHVSLISPGSYTALSYYWGDAEPKKKISLNGYKQEVTINLYHALQELRRFHVAMSPQQPLRVWVDALCINQGDDRERRSVTLKKICAMV